jgi:Transcriptional regulator
MSRPHKEEERKDATIRAIWACLARYGVEGTTIERIAELGGFSRGVIHYYYDSKRELLLAALEAFMSSYDQEIEARIAALGPKLDAASALDAIIESCLPPFAAEDLEAADIPLLAAGEALTPKYKARLFVQFFVLAMGDKDFAAVIAASYERQCAAMAQCFGSPAGGEGDPRSTAAAAGLAALIDGFSLHRVLGFMPPGIPDHAELAKRFSQTAIAGMGRKE